MTWKDPLFWAAAGAGGAAAANLLLTILQRVQTLRHKTESVTLEMAARKESLEELLATLESARRSNVESAELIQKVEAELGLANGPGTFERGP